MAMLLLEGHDGPVTALAFAPCSDVLASAGRDGSLRLWSPSMQSTALAVADAPLLCLAFSGDGNLLAAGGADGVASVHDLRGGLDPKKMPAQIHPVTAIGFLQ